jgi:hypothetical protein
VPLPYPPIHITTKNTKVRGRGHEGGTESEISRFRTNPDESREERAYLPSPGCYHFGNMMI